MEGNNKEPKKIVPPISPSRLKQGGTFTSEIVPRPMTTLAKQQNNETASIKQKEKVYKEATLPVNKKKKIAILSLVALLIMVLLTVALVLFLPQPYRANDIVVDFSTSATLTPAGGIIPGEPTKVMPGDDIDCTFNVLSSAQVSGNETLDVFVRVRVYGICEGRYFGNIISLKLTDSTKWVRGADGYYYYKSKLSPNQSIDIANQIHLETSIDNWFGGKTLNVVFSAEALQAEYQAIVELWPTAPIQWSANFK